GELAVLAVEDRIRAQDATAVSTAAYTVEGLQRVGVIAPGRLVSVINRLGGGQSVTGLIGPKIFKVGYGRDLADWHAGVNLTGQLTGCLAIGGAGLRVDESSRHGQIV